MRAYPEWTSGTSRDERRLMDAVPGLLVKGGAEGVDAFALGDGRAGAVKIDDGAQRARTPVTVAALRLLGAAVPDELATAPGHRRRAPRSASYAPSLLTPLEVARGRRTCASRLIGLTCSYDY